MQMLRNHVQLIGHAGKDVDVYQFDSGKKKANITLATAHYYKNTQGEFITNTQWHNLVAWGATAEAMEKSLKKGDQIIVKGSLNYRTYEDKSGATRTITEILVNEFFRIKSANAKESESLIGSN
jgi:single-strand DNA-binding protein